MKRFRLLIMINAWLLLAGCWTWEPTRDLPPNPGITGHEARKPSLAILDSRYARMRRGVNLYGWFAGNDKLVSDDKHRLTFINKADIERIRSVGITTVRLCVSPYPLFDENNPSQFKDQKFISSLDSSVRLLLDAGLSVTLVLFPRDDIKERFFRDPDFVQKFAIFWATLAQKLRHFDPDSLFFEVINEPNFIRYSNELQVRYPNAIEKSAAKRWGMVQEQLLKAIRREAPEHTIVLTCDNLSKIRNLITMKPHTDPNVVYTVHIYDPYAFTHQGAEWDARVSGISGLSYPTDLSNCKIVKENIPERSREIVEKYCLTQWNRKKIEHEVRVAVLWAKKHNVKLWVGEFGAYPNHVSPDKAAQYLRDMRTTLEKYGIGWCAWEYVDWLDRLQSDELRGALGLRSP